MTSASLRSRYFLYAVHNEFDATADRAGQKERAMFLTTIIARIQSYLRYRDTVRQLSQLTDRELEDLGLHRSGITETAWRHAFA